MRPARSRGTEQSERGAIVVIGAGHATPLDVGACPGPGELAEWDALVAATPGTDVTQLSVWATVRKLEGFRPLYLFLRREGRLVGGAQVLVRRLPGLGRVGYVSYGPVVAAGIAEHCEVAESLANGLASLGGMRMLFVQPPEDGHAVREGMLAHGFRCSTAGIAPIGSVRLDLRQTEDTIRRNFSPRLRSWTRRWADHGVTVRMGGVEDIPLLAGLMQAAADVRGDQPPPRVEYLRHLYSELAQTGNAALFLGEVHGVPVTADIVTMCGDMVRGRLGGFDRSGEGRRLSVPAAARWEIIRWAQRAGYQRLDFGGLSERTLHDTVDCGIRSCDSWPGADRAKLSFGGVPFRYPGPVELIRPRVVRQAYDAVSGYAWGRAALHRVKVGLRSGEGLRPPGGGVAAPWKRAVKS
jgi:lipid II:glycine glycyltransferase (peptidoglycan interpeptide bridge formation enzyme)